MTFDDYVTAHLTTPFVWGKHDCILFAVGWLNIRAGKDWLADLPKWTTEREARRVILYVGGITSAFDNNLKRIDARMARDGDIALVGRTTFLFCGASIVGPGPDGLLFNDRAHACLAWSL